jgi:thioesterase domain-containing protein
LLQRAIERKNNFLQAITIQEADTEQIEKRSQLRTAVRSDAEQIDDDGKAISRGTSRRSPQHKPQTWWGLTDWHRDRLAREERHRAREMPPGCIKIVVYALKLMHSSAKSKIVSRWVHQYSESKLHRNLGCSVEESNCDVNKKNQKLIT